MSKTKKKNIVDQDRIWPTKELIIKLQNYILMCEERSKNPKDRSAPRNHLSAIMLLFKVMENFDFEEFSSQRSEDLLHSLRQKDVGEQMKFVEYMTKQLK